MERINKYFGRVQALNDVTVSVRKNEIVAGCWATMAQASQP